MERHALALITPVASPDQPTADGCFGGHALDLTPVPAVPERCGQFNNTALRWFSSVSQCTTARGRWNTLGLREGGAAGGAGRRKASHVPKSANRERRVVTAEKTLGCGREPVSWRGRATQSVASPRHHTSVAAFEVVAVGGLMSAAETRLRRHESPREVEHPARGELRVRIPPQSCPATFTSLLYSPIIRNVGTHCPTKRLILSFPFA